MSSNFFFEMGKHQRLIHKNQGILSLFEVAFDLTDKQENISTLQKEFLITEFMFNYLFFGACLFSSGSLKLMADGFEKNAKIPSEFFYKYSKNIKEFLAEEAPDFQNLISDENMEILFAKEYVKRVFSTDKKEDVQTGFHVFDKSYTEKLRNISHQILFEMSQGEVDLDDKSLVLRNQISDIYFHPALELEFWSFLKKVQHDALNFITSRFDSFIWFQHRTEQSYFLLKKDSDTLAEISRQISVLMTLFILESNKQPILKNNLLTISQAVKIFSEKTNENYFSLIKLSHWLQLENELQSRDTLKSILEEAVLCGVIFKIPHGKKDFYYGLSDVGFNILKPYSGILNQSFSN
jgi:hypothetical protein